MNLKDLQNFNKLLTKFQKVERVVNVPGTPRRENDAEHSFNLTLLAWFIIDAGKLTLDKAKVLQYALIHDFVEVFAGDVFFYATPQEKLKKKIREHKAQARLKKELPAFRDLHTVIEKYERQNDPESRFVKALDKLHPILTIFEDGGRLWREKGITLEILITAKRPFLERSVELLPYFDELVKLLHKHKKKFPARSDHFA